MHPSPSAPNLSAFPGFGFRRLHWAGTTWAPIAIWIYAPQRVTGPLQAIAWHAHEILWGFVATIAVAFLMTAGATWTGIDPLRGGALAVIIGMTTRTALGHLGGPIAADRSMVASYLLVLSAAALRLAAVEPAPFIELSLRFAAGARIAAFGLSPWRFAPLLVGPGGLP